MSCDNYTKKIKIGLSNEEKQKLFNELDEKVSTRVSKLDKIISELKEWEEEGNWVPKYTATDLNSVAINSNKDNLSIGVYQGVDATINDNILTQLYMSTNEIKIKNESSSMILTPNKIDITSDCITFNGKDILEDSAITIEELEKILN